MIRQHVAARAGAPRLPAGREAHPRGPRRQAALRADARRDRPDEERRRASWPARSRTRWRCGSGRSTKGALDTRRTTMRKSLASTTACRWRSSSSGATARSRSSSPSATCRTPSATPPASCCSWCGASRSASAACAPTCSCRRSPRSRQAFSTYPVERAIEWALKGAPVDYHCRSDFGYAFSRFAKHRARVARPQDHDPACWATPATTTTIPQAWALRLIRERVKGIIWLNPEGQWGWGIGDSVMPLYAPACDIVRECRTIGQLGEVVDNLVHHWWRRGR